MFDQARLDHSEGNHIDLVNIKTIVGLFDEFLFASLVPKLVKHLVIVLLPQSCLYDGVQVLLGDDSHHTVTVGAHLNIDEFLAGLQSPRELKVEAPRHQNDLDQHYMDHVSPAHT